MLDSIRRHRRTLHRMPEIGFDLPRTHAYIASALSQTCAHVETVAQSGVIAWFDAHAETAIAYRTDMDALSITEHTGASFASEVEGRMHACGHDGHMAVMLAFAEYVDALATAGKLKKNVLLIFEPAEETTGGGRDIVETGVLERYGIREIYAIHVDPELPEGVLASRPGALMARSGEVHITVHGKSAHAAKAEEGIDALRAAVSLLESLYAMEAALPAEVPHLLKFGMFSAGTAVNIIADTAMIGGTMRAFSEEDFAFLRAQLEALVSACEEKFGVKIDLSVGDGYPPLVNDLALFEKVQSSLSGMDFRVLPAPSMLAEDFSFFTRAVPGLMLKVGVGGEYGLHNDRFIFREEALLPALEAYKKLLKA